MRHNETAAPEGTSCSGGCRGEEGVEAGGRGGGVILAQHKEVTEMPDAKC